MIKYFCDKCGEQIGAMVVYRPFSFSKNKDVQLCGICFQLHEKAIEKADKDFFDNADMRGEDK